MAVSIEDIKKLRQMTGAGMMDCKNALAETGGDIQASIEIIRKKVRLLPLSAKTVRPPKVAFSQAPMAISQPL